MESPEKQNPASSASPVIRVIGLGGGGANAVARFAPLAGDGIKVMVANTDARALEALQLKEKRVLGRGITRGLGCGGDPELGQAVAEAERGSLVEMVAGADLLFLVTALGGGTGSGMAPVLAKAATDQGAMVITFANLPFSFEGNRRRKVAEESLHLLREASDALIVVPNDLLIQGSEEAASVGEVFQLADQWISLGIHSMGKILFEVGLVNLDFSTLRRALGGKGGKTLFSIASAEGEGYMEKALQALFECPLLSVQSAHRGADSLVVHLVGGRDLSMSAVSGLVQSLNEKFGSREETFVGAVVDETREAFLEICILGMIDMENRRFFRGRSTIPRITPRVPAGPGQGDGGSGGDPDGSSHPGQEEFEELIESGQRGMFEKTGRNLHEGIDLDIPTFIRRGIRIRAEQ